MSTFFDRQREILPADLPPAPDAVTFFAEWVFGPRYPELVSLVLGPGLLEHRIRKGRHRGELTDAWLRLLQRAELLPSP
jgi:hypothetical protein